MMGKNTLWSRHSAAVATAFALSVALVGCASASSSTNTEDSPVAGGTLDIGLGSEVSCLDPATTYVSDALSVGRMVVDSLVAQDPTTGEFQPWLASTWEVAADATSYTFTLADGVTFSDGSALDAEVVKKNIDNLVALGAESSQIVGFFSSFAEATVVDSQTVRVNFSAPTPNFLSAVSQPTFGIMSAESVGKTIEDRCAGDFVGTGPYVIDSVQQNEQATLSRREGYTSPPPFATHTGDAYIEKIVYHLMPDEAVRNGALQSGQVSLISQVSPVSATTLTASGLETMTAVVPGMGNQLLARVGSGPLSDPAVRAALQHAIDRVAIVDAAVNGSFPVSTDVLSSSTVGHTDHSTLMSLDNARVVEELDAAGWTEGSNGYREKDGQQLSIRLIYFTGIYFFSESVAQLLQAQLTELGINVELSGSDGNTFQQRQAAGEYDLAMINSSGNDADIMRSDVVALLPDGQDQAIDAGLIDLSASIQHEPDAETRSALVEELSAQLIEEGWVFPLFEMVETVAYDSRVAGVQMDALARPYLYDAWVR